MQRFDNASVQKAIVNIQNTRQMWYNYTSKPHKNSHRDASTSGGLTNTYLGGVDMSDTTTHPYFPENLNDYAPWVAKHGLRAPYGKCQCGCGQDAPPAQRTRNERGNIAGEPVRFVYGHNLRKQFTESDFWNRVKKGDECWCWQAAKSGAGYGQLRIDGKTVYAHRISYELTNGPIPAGTEVCHHCDVKDCVRPSHLFLGTHAENMRDFQEKGLHNSRKGEEHNAAKLTEEKVRTLRRMAENGHTHRGLATFFGVSKSTISQVLYRKTWRHVE